MMTIEPRDRLGLRREMINLAPQAAPGVSAIETCPIAGGSRSILAVVAKAVMRLAGIREAR